ncbi:MAG TPA: hypothetical protein VE174_08635 [Actinomycetota bacterium]|nr:hypothetical protein [Actinomycetota bacterium]
MSTIAPSSSAFRTRQSRLFARMAAIPFETYQLDVAWGRFGDLTRRSLEKKYADADRISVPVTEERYQIAGIDPQPAAEDLFYTFVEIDGEWFVAEDTDLDDLTLYSARHLWDFGPVEESTADGFVMYQHPCSGGVFCGDDKLLTAARQGLERVQEYWREVPSQVLILVPASQNEVERMIQATFDLDNFVAFAYSTIDVADGVDYTGHRIIVNPPAFRGRDSTSTMQILAHELLHVSTREASGPFIPVFVEEGFADHVGYDADPNALGFLQSRIEQGVFDGRLPEDYEFTIGTGDEIFNSYQESLSAVQFFIDRWGIEKFRRFYRALGQIKNEPGTTRYWLDMMLKRTIGIGTERFEDEWADTIAGL